MKEMEIRKTSKVNAAEEVEIAKKAETAEENVKEAEMSENEKVMLEVKRQMGIILKGAVRISKRHKAGNRKEDKDNICASPLSWRRAGRCFVE